MRLGLWNRLAIVATVLAVFIAPAWVIVGIIDDSYEGRDARYDLCMQFAQDGPPNEFGEAIRLCGEARTASAPYRPTWAEWGELALGTLIVCVVLYGLIWLAAWVAKWVWRGRARAQKNTKSE